jgi:hypothetical protein
VFNHHYEDLYFFPWERKRPKAFMRASQQGCMPANSSRAVLAVTSEYHPQQLDLGITRIDGSDKHFLKFRWAVWGLLLGRCLLLASVDGGMYGDGSVPLGCGSEDTKGLCMLPVSRE